MKKYILIVLISGSLFANNLHRYMWANYKQFGGTTQEVQEWYNRIFASDRHSIFSNKGYLYFLRDHGNHQRIVELMPKLQDSFKHDPDIQIIFISALKKAGQHQQADDMLIRLSREFKSHAELVLQATETFIQRKELANALSLIDDYLNSAPRRPHNFIFYFLKGQVYIQMHDYKQARLYIEQCLEAHPRFPQGWLLLAILEEQQGKIDDAIKGYTSYLEIAGSNKQIERHVLELTMQQKTAQTNQQVLFVNQPSFQKSVILFERKQYQAALDQLNQCTPTEQKEVQNRLLKVQILSALRKFDDILKLVASWIMEEPDNALWYQTLHVLSRTHIPLIDTINTYTTTHKKYPQKLLPLLYLADVHTRAGTLDQAITYHSLAKNTITDPQLKIRLIYQLAVLYYERNEYDKMVTTLNELDTIGSYAPSFNLRAYYLATEGNNVAKAQEYFDKAYAQDRGNPHFLDTQAVIFYKQKDYEKALRLLQPIAQKLPQDGSILIHLAKTYDKLGQYENARTTIDQAQKYAHTPYEKKTSTMLALQWKKT